MNLTGNTILITGGGTGIGLALAESFLARDNRVLICGRRQEKLDEACQKLAGLRAYRCDITDAEDRQELFQAIERDGYRPNVLINNAGVMQRYDFGAPDKIDLAQVENDVYTNFLAPIALVQIFLPCLLEQRGATIINISSPLGTVPVAAVPIYSASKAALDSYTRSLRLQLQGQVEVIGVCPPAVETAMMENTRINKISVAKCNAELMALLEKGGHEIWVGEGRHIRWLNRLMPKQIFKIVNKTMQVG